MVFNQLIKWTIIVGLWRKYKSHVVASCFLLISLILINYIHLDYIEYSVATGSSNLGFSYLLKWSAFVLAIGLFAWQIKRVNIAAKYDSKLHKMMKATTTPEEKAIKPELDKEAHKTDPFANIRSKKKLRSEADFIIGKKD